MKKIESHKIYGGEQQIWQHNSISTHTPMKFAIFLPSKAVNGEACSVLYWLSGLTCNEQNFITKSGFQRYAEAHDLIVVCPDTSPRSHQENGDVADDKSYDLGQGAGFYVNATEQPWAKHFQMFDYVADELPRLINGHFSTTGKQSVFGHSMGGHGALMIGLKNPDIFASISAFSPIVAPSQVPWGEKAFSAYLGNDKSLWENYDSVALLKNFGDKKKLPILIDQGLSDEFLTEQLKPKIFQQVAEQIGYPIQLRMQAGYDHSYYFIATFIGEHIAFHAKALAGEAF